MSHRGEAREKLGILAKSGHSKWSWANSVTDLCPLDFVDFIGSYKKIYSYSMKIYRYPMWIPSSNFVEKSDGSICYIYDLRGLRVLCGTQSTWVDQSLYCMNNCYNYDLGLWVLYREWKYSMGYVQMDQSDCIIGQNYDLPVYIVLKFPFIVILNTY